MKAAALHLCWIAALLGGCSGRSLYSLDASTEAIIDHIYEMNDETNEDGADYGNMPLLLPARPLPLRPPARPLSIFSEASDDFLKSEDITKIQPVKSIQEVKSVQEVKDITPIDDSVARRAIKELGLRDQLGGGTPSREAGSLLSSEEDKESINKEQEIKSLIDGEIKEKEEEIETDERIIQALITVKAKHLQKIKNILSLKSLKEVESIDEVKSIQPIKSIKEVQSIDEVKSIQPIKSINKVDSIDEVKSIQEVKRMYALTPAQAQELKKLLHVY